MNPNRIFQPSYQSLAAALLVVSILCSSFLPEDEFKKLLFLVGTWKMETRKGPLFEQWRKFDDSSLAGMSYRLANGDTVLLERIQLVTRAEGIFYIPVVENQNEGRAVSFRLISSEGTRFVFENKEHDFPQRIIYSVVTMDSMVARIEGISRGKAASSEFHYKRVGGK